MSATKEAPAVQSPPGELTAGEVDAAVAEFQAAITSWETSPMMARAAAPLAIDNELVGAATAMLELFERAGPRSAAIAVQELLLQAETFREKLADWITKSVILVHGQTPPTEQIWMFWREMLRHRQPRQPRPAPLSPAEQVLNLSSIQFNPKLPTPWDVLRQIALELQWRDEHGRWDTERVLRELREPGCEWKPSEWRDAKFEKYAADLAQRWATHRGKLVARRGLPVLPRFIGGTAGTTPRAASFLR